MSATLGIIFAFVAMLCWGFGDFLIQKSTRKDGDWETLWVITALSTLVLTPILYKDILVLFTRESSFILLLFTGGIVLLVSSLLDFEALKRGKLSVIEPIWSIEIITAAILAFFFANEILSNLQLTMTGLLIIGLFMVSLRSYHLSKRVWVEKGALIALIAAATMGIANYLTGIASRGTGAIITIWFLHAVLFLMSSLYLGYTARTKRLIKHIKAQKGRLLAMGILDNSAWIAFAAAMSLTPIAIAVALSDSYILITVILGMYVNKEFLRKHQKIGLVIALFSAVTLAAITI